MRYAFDQKTGLSVAALWARRYGLTEKQYSVGIDRRITDDLFGYARASITPAAEFLASRTLSVGAEWKLPHGDGQFPSSRVLVDCSAARYAPGTVQSASVGLNQDTGLRLAMLRLPRAGSSGNILEAKDAGSSIVVTPRYSITRNLNGHWTRGWQFRLAGDFSANWHWDLGYADSRESLSSTVFDFLREVRNRAVFVGWMAEFSPVFGVRVDLSHEWSPGSPARNTAHVGVITRF